MPRSAPSLKAKALAYLAQREHSHVELRRKLVEHVARRSRAAAASSLSGDAPPVLPTEAEIDALLDALAAQGLLSAERFVEGRIHARAARFGNLRIRHELARHGLEPDAEQGRMLAAGELARARTVWAKRFGAVASDAADRARQMRFLAARGFSAEVVRRVVGGAAEDDAC